MDEMRMKSQDISDIHHYLSKRDGELLAYVWRAVHDISTSKRGAAAVK